MSIIQILFIIIFPMLITKLHKSSSKFKYLSPILICYIVGILLGNIKFLSLDKQLSMSISEVAVPLAIPFILFSTDFIKWIKLAKKTVLSFCLVVISSMTSSALIALLLHNRVNEYWKISGMLTGVYTGGTPNLMAVGMGLDVNSETLVLVNASDMLLGGIYFVLIITVIKWGLRRILPKFEYVDYQQEVTEAKEIPAFESIFTYNFLKKVGKFALIFLLAAIIVGVSCGAALLITGELAVAPIMLIVTTLGIGCSFIKPIREIKGSYEIGQYIILVFSLAIGSTVEISEFFSSSSILFGYTAGVMFLSIIIHFILAAIFRVDADTTIITSTAGIYGPAFVGPIADVLDNKQVVLSGLICGLVGYALGNYLGLFMGFILMPK